MKLTAQPCYRGTRSGARTRRGTACWPSRSGGGILRTRAVRLLIETMGGPSWQTVYLCDKHRREAADAGTLKALAR